MFKYIKLDSVLNFVSPMVKEQADSPQLLQYANQAYRKLSLPNIQYDLKTVILEVVDHKAKLPKDVKKILSLWYTSIPLPPDQYTIVVDLNEEERIVTLQQQLFLSSTWANESLMPLHYLGQNKSALIDDSLYCKDCGYGFSVDSSLSCLTIDLPDTTLVMEYMATMADEDCNLLIPDNPTLQEGLAAYSSAMIFKDLADRGKEGANNRYMSYLQLSQNLLNKFRGQIHLMNIQPALYEKFRQKRFDVPGNFYQYKRNPSFRRNLR